MQVSALFTQSWWDVQRPEGTSDEVSFASVNEFVDFCHVSQRLQTRPITAIGFEILTSKVKPSLTSRLGKIHPFVVQLMLPRPGLDGSLPSIACLA